MLSHLRFLTAGESHGPKLFAILEGLPAGLRLDPEAINAQLARRQRGFGTGQRMKIEQDRVRIVGGWMAGQTTGGPLGLELENKDWANWKERDIPPMTVPRPGHADLTGALKYDHADLRLSLERASARETAARVAAGACCRALLAEVGIAVGGYLSAIGPVDFGLPTDVHTDEHRARIATALENDLGCPSVEHLAAAHDAIAETIRARDTLGGVMALVALGVPPGLGSYTQWDRRLDGRLAMALLSIPAMKGLEFDQAFLHARQRGTQVHDELIPGHGGTIERLSNRAGGLEGGITNGAPLVMRVAMKPLATTLEPLRSVDLASGEGALATYERSDFCALPRAIPIGEAMVALVLADALLETLGGDTMGQIEERFAALRQLRFSDFHLRGEAWRFEVP